ncbi:MAG TPA: glutaredoxin 3 [Alphaproteobacteria bacterium]|nr:glutaredoxin 3 [Alphaproteobacteria bacterium]
MAKVEIYSTNVCPYCVKAKNLLKIKGATWEEFNIQTDQARRDEMLQRSGGRTSVPQIFIDGKHIGGCDDLYALNDAGGLEPLLK